MTATAYFSAPDDELRAEDEGGKVRIVVGNFAWTFVLENRLDCARWMKALADADALFVRRKAADDAHDVIVPPLPSPPIVAEIQEALAATERGETQDLGDLLQYADDEDDLEPLPPLPQRKPAGPPGDISDTEAVVFRAVVTGDGAELADHLRQKFAKPEPQPGGTIYKDLTPAALAGGVPLESLAPEHEDEEAEA